MQRLFSPLLLFLAAPLAAQQVPDQPPIACDRYVPIIAVGDVPCAKGLRINLRDGRLREVVGVNATVWSPRKAATGARVRGVALGLPVTGGAELRGVNAGALGIGATRTLEGVSLGGLGVGGGGAVRGIALAGLGVGAGGDMEGLAIAGLGAGGGGAARGALVAGLGAGVGGDVHGLVVAGLGAGAGGSMRGVAVAGLGVGSGGDLGGVRVAGLGVGAGGNVTGLTIAGLGAGAGGSLSGLAVAGLGLGAPRVSGVMVAPLVGAERARAVAVAPVWFRLADGGRFDGVALSTFNQMKGTQRGLSIGLVNYARQLEGVQLGLLNIARRGAVAPVTLVANWRR